MKRLDRIFRNGLFASILFEAYGLYSGQGWLADCGMAAIITTFLLWEACQCSERAARKKARMAKKRHAERRAKEVAR